MVHIIRAPTHETLVPRNDFITKQPLGHYRDSPGNGNLAAARSCRHLAPGLTATQDLNTSWLFARNDADTRVIGFNSHALKAPLFVLDRQAGTLEGRWPGTEVTNPSQIFIIFPAQTFEETLL